MLEENPQHGARKRGNSKDNAVYVYSIPCLNSKMRLSRAFLDCRLSLFALI